MTHTVLAALVRVSAGGALGVVALVHWRSAPAHDLIGDVVTQGDLFRVQAAAAAALAAAVLVSSSRLVWWAAGLLSGLSLLAVVGTTYVAVPELGPFPRVYEPIWYADKVLAAVAAAVACCSVAAWARASMASAPPAAVRPTRTAVSPR